MRTTTNFFLANLAVADILVALFCILQNMYQLVITDHSVWIFVCVSVEKYLAVSSPLQSWGTLTKKVRVNMTVSTWFLAFTFNLPYFFTAKLHEFENESSCSRQMDKDFLRHWVTISFIFWYFIPLIIIGYIYAKIGMVLWHSASGTTAVAIEADSEYELQPSRQVKCSNSKRPIRYGSLWSKSNGSTTQWKISESSSTSQYRKVFRNENIEARRKVVRLLIAIVLSFAILTLPHHIRLVYMMWKTDPVICVASYYFYIQPITYLLLFLSSSINPLLYAFFSSKFRSAAYELLCR
uniref:G_PROTEIN_RECEP_F1_2 domain-containing protein n=1 Tax=Syphacia muris TaxID=451379 RepID=A0A0N5A834_9BILA